MAEDDDSGPPEELKPYLLLGTADLMDGDVEWLQEISSSVFADCLTRVADKLGRRPTTDEAMVIYKAVIAHMNSAVVPHLRALPRGT